jgi:hypothetical protein
VTNSHNQEEVGAPRSRGRRHFMFGAAAAGAGLAAGLIADAEPADAASGGSVKLGGANTATATTSVSTTKGTGLQGKTAANGNSGVEGDDDSPEGGSGVLGISPKGYGIYGVSSSRYGVAGNSGSGDGVYGNSDSGNGVLAQSATGNGVLAHSQSGNAIYAYSGSNNTVLVQANASSGECVGVHAFNVSSPQGYAVYATAQHGTALFAYGNATVSGTLSKAGGSFQIDHPLDPAHKYLYHSFVESPDMMNVYNGTVNLDGRGQAAVDLPDWLETLNRDFRYQLTAIGAAAPDLHIAAKITNGTFAIAGGKPGLEVSWQVTGIRQDAWANANRIPVEVDKPAHDQGRYLHPELYEDGHGEPIKAILVGRRHTERVSGGSGLA